MKDMEKNLNLNSAVLDGSKWKNDASALAEFRECEVFFPLTQLSEPVPNGPLIGPAGIDLKLPFVELNGMPLAIFFTTKEDARMKGQIGGVPLIAAMRMAVDSPSVQGLLLQSNQDRWIAVLKEELSRLI